MAGRHVFTRPERGREGGVHYSFLNSVGYYNTTGTPHFNSKLKTLDLWRQHLFVLLNLLFANHHEDLRLKPEIIYG